MGTVFDPEVFESNSYSAPETDLCLSKGDLPAELRGECFLNSVTVKIGIEEILNGPEQEYSHDYNGNQDPQEEFFAMTTHRFCFMKEFLKMRISDCGINYFKFRF